MSRFAPDCIPEWQLGAYVDEGLDAGGVRNIETHLVGCEDCRRIVVALREEASVLAKALHGDARPRSEAIALEAPASGVMTGLPLGIAAAVAVATGISLVLETRLPEGLDWLHPARLLGVSDMFWNLIFVLRDDAPGFVEFAVGVGALASVATLGAFVAGAVSKRLTGTAAGLLLLFGGLVPLGLAVPAEAALDFRVDEEVIHIRADETVDGVLFASGRTVILEGTVNGDAVLWAERVEVSGVVIGNLVTGGDDVEITGTVEGSLIGGGDVMRLDGVVKGSAAIGTGSFTMGSSAKVERDLSVGGGRVIIGGDVARDANVGTPNLQVTGRIGRDLQFGGESLVVTGTVLGDIEAHVRDEERVRVDGAEQIGGELTVISEPPEFRSPWSHLTDGRFWMWRLVWLAGAFTVGMLLYWALPGLFRIGVRTGGEFATALGVGLVSAPAVGIAVIILSLTFIGLPLAVILALLYGTSMYLAFLVMSALIGRHLTRPSEEGLREFGLSLLVGLALVTAIIHLPYVGPAARWVLLFSGLGLLLMRTREVWLLREVPRA
jgi:anti-sigma factor RsiW